MKQELTNREKCCVVYGYVRRMAEESKENGLFNDLTEVFKDKTLHLLQKQIRTFCRKLCYLSVRSVRKGTLPFTIPVYGIVGVKPFLMLEAIVSSFI